ncbi:hypothetical protein NSK_007569 [Nannochloropsis salina CCMP1776]|uniref:Uncharacterized protein n=1 Tax=Nannochloropsis salina CCMP1776 TaxID=1027361 RepID=A0A4D9CQ97_9STRA|nr:hypothetical protein NSK_007569 [Nannochloropsis salina CCMP1776]|eukprot:TFJ80926.1 hypothetical protein NSK_007569 [Nannochloropsis salina CCMP1776]
MFRAALFKASRSMPMARYSNHARHVVHRHASTGRSAWLRDPAVYPLLGIIGSAMVLCSTFMVHFTTSSPDIRINKTKRQSVVRVD